MRRAMRSVGALAVVVLAAAACGKSNDNGGGGGGGGGGSLTLAFVGAQTGPNAQLGINISNGAQLAVDQHNAKKGVTKVTLKLYDTQGDPTQASSQAKKVVQDKDIGVIGPAFSGESKTADPIFEAAKIPYVSASATAVALAHNGWKYFHRVLANDDVQGPKAADFLVNTVGAKKVAVIDDQSEYGLGLADAVRKQVKSDGATDVKDDAIDPTASDFSSTVNAVKAANPDAVYFAGYYDAAAKLVKQLRDGGFHGTFMSADGSLDPKLISLGGSATNGAFLSCTCAVGSTVAGAAAFNRAYQAKYHSAPATYSSEGYDVATLFLKAIDAGKTTPTAINDWLTNVNYQGVSKHIQFDQNGELKADLLFITEVVHGKLKFLGDSTTAKPAM